MTAVVSPQRITLNKARHSWWRQVATWTGTACRTWSGRCCAGLAEGPGWRTVPAFETIDLLFDAQNMDIRDIDLDGDLTWWWLTTAPTIRCCTRTAWTKRALNTGSDAGQGVADPVVGGSTGAASRTRWCISSHDVGWAGGVGASSRLGQVSVEGLSSGTYLVRGVDAYGNDLAAVSFIVPLNGPAEPGPFASSCPWRNCSPWGIIALLTLTTLEIALGIDNVIFVSIILGRMPEEKRLNARRIWMVGGIALRSALLLGLGWLVERGERALPRRLVLLQPAQHDHAGRRSFLL